MPIRACPGTSGIPFDERNRFQGVRYHHEIGGLRILFRSPFDLRNLGAVGEVLAVTGNAVPVSLDHCGIGDDHFDPVFGLTDGDILPVFVSSELRKRGAWLESTPSLTAFFSHVGHMVSPGFNA
jgi:hypothetical protein